MHLHIVSKSSDEDIDWFRLQSCAHVHWPLTLISHLFLVMFLSNQLGSTMAELSGHSETVLVKTCHHYVVITTIYTYDCFLQNEPLGYYQVATCRETWLPPSKMAALPVYNHISQEVFATMLITSCLSIVVIRDKRQAESKHWQHRLHENSTSVSDI